MAEVIPVPIVFNNALFKVAAHNYEKSVSRVLLTPIYPETEWSGIGGNTIAGIGTAQWTCEIDYPQDWATANSLAKYLFDNQGTTVVADLTPKAGGVGFRVNLVLKAGPIGGAVNEQLPASVSLKVSGQPVTPIPA